MEVNMTMSGAGEFTDSIDEVTNMFAADEAYSIYTDVDHGLYQELGTIHHGPQPHFRPAVQSVGGSFSSRADGSPTVAHLLEGTANDLYSEWRRRAPVRSGELRGSITVQQI